MRIGIKTFWLPGQDRMASQFMNTPGIVVTINERYPCPKEGTILLHLQYEDYRSEEQENEDNACLSEIIDEAEKEDGAFNL